MRQRPRILRRALGLLTGALGAFVPLAQRTPAPNAPAGQQQQRQQSSAPVTETPTATIAERVFGSGHARRVQSGRFVWLGRTLRGRSGQRRKRRHDYQR